MLGFACFTTAVAQKSNDVDKKLLAKYSLEELEEIKKSNESTYNFHVKVLSNGWYLTDFPKKKAQQSKGRYTDITLTQAEMDDFNMYQHNIELLENDYQYFRVNGGEKMLVIRSIDHINQLINK